MNVWRIFRLISWKCLVWHPFLRLTSWMLSLTPFSRSLSRILNFQSVLLVFVAKVWLSFHSSSVAQLKISSLSLVKTSKVIQSTHVLTPLYAFTLESLLRRSKALLIDTALHQRPDYIHPFSFLDFSRLPIPSFAEANSPRERRIYGKCKVEIMQSFVSTNPSIQTQSVADRNKTFLYPVPI